MNVMAVQANEQRDEAGPQKGEQRSNEVRSNQNHIIASSRKNAPPNRAGALIQIRT